MLLTKSNTNRDYLYGRLWAICKHYARLVHDDNFELRWYERFHQKPYTYWGKVCMNVHQNLLQANKITHPNYLKLLRQFHALEGDVTCMFESVESFQDDRPLGAQSLLGDSMQALVLKERPTNPAILEVFKHYEVV